MIIKLTKSQMDIAEWAIDLMFDHLHSEDMIECLGRIIPLQAFIGIVDNNLIIPEPIDKDILEDFLYRIQIQLNDMLKSEPAEVSRPQRKSMNCLANKISKLTGYSMTSNSGMIYTKPNGSAVRTQETEKQKKWTKIFSDHKIDVWSS